MVWSQWHAYPLFASLLAWQKSDTFFTVRLCRPCPPTWAYIICIYRTFPITMSLNVYYCRLRTHTSSAMLLATTQDCTLATLTPHHQTRPQPLECRICTFWSSPLWKASWRHKYHEAVCWQLLHLTVYNSVGCQNHGILTAVWGDGEVVQFEEGGLWMKLEMGWAGDRDIVEVINIPCMVSSEMFAGSQDSNSKVSSSRLKAKAFKLGQMMVLISSKGSEHILSSSLCRACKHMTKRLTEFFGGNVSILRSSIVLEQADSMRSISESSSTSSQANRTSLFRLINKEGKWSLLLLGQQFPCVSPPSHTALILGYLWSSWDMRPSTLGPSPHSSQYTAWGCTCRDGVLWNGEIQMGGMACLGQFRGWGQSYGRYKTWSNEALDILWSGIGSFLYLVKLLGPMSAVEEVEGVNFVCITINLTFDLPPLRATHRNMTGTFALQIGMFSNGTHRVSAKSVT